MAKIEHSIRWLSSCLYAGDSDDINFGLANPFHASNCPFNELCTLDYCSPVMSVIDSLSVNQSKSQKRHPLNIWEQPVLVLIIKMYGLCLRFDFSIYIFNTICRNIGRKFMTKHNQSGSVSIDVSILNSATFQMVSTQRKIVKDSISWMNSSFSLFISSFCYSFNQFEN